MPINPAGDEFNTIRVFNFVSKLLDASECLKPLPLHEDGDLIAYIQDTLDKRGRSTLKVTNVEGHATGEMMVEDKGVWW